MNNGRTFLISPLCVIAVIVIIFGWVTDRADGASILGEMVYGTAYDGETGEPLKPNTLICYHDNVVFGFDRPESVCCMEVDSSHNFFFAANDTIDGALPDIYFEIAAEGYYPFLDTLTNYAISLPMPCGDDTCYVIMRFLDSIVLQPVSQSASNDVMLLLPDAEPLLTNYPNPFNSETTVSFRLARGAEVRLEVYDLLGRRIKALRVGAYPAGEQKATWNGEDNRGHDVASGIYYCVLRVGEQVTTRKLLYLK